ncbi:hypothetical protein Cgig2_028972 [Carnegiea gigantea]|uniref:Uncharacterized protein n=1 Tax=Carnegiea gigantea TaxID=171969 RepID=A0A9Q1JVQ9_9CARY|nr:hypothetical protein Cgig2_028972 [Carnegiea gigantea]
MKDENDRLVQGRATYLKKNRHANDSDEKVSISFTSLYSIIKHPQTDKTPLFAEASCSTCLRPTGALRISWSVGGSVANAKRPQRTTCKKSSVNKPNRREDDAIQSINSRRRGNLTIWNVHKDHRVYRPSHQQLYIVSQLRLHQAGRDPAEAC